MPLYTKKFLTTENTNGADGRQIAVGTMAVNSSYSVPNGISIGWQANLAWINMVEYMVYAWIAAPDRSVVVSGRSTVSNASALLYAKKKLLTDLMADYDRQRTDLNARVNAIPEDRG